MNVVKFYKKQEGRILLTYYIPINVCTVKDFNLILNEIHHDFPNARDEDLEFVYRDSFAYIVRALFYIRFSVTKEDFMPETISELMDEKKFYSHFEEPL